MSRLLTSPSIFTFVRSHNLPLPTRNSQSHNDNRSESQVFVLEHIIVLAIKIEGSNWLEVVDNEIYTCQKSHIIIRPVSIYNILKRSREQVEKIIESHGQNEPARRRLELRHHHRASIWNLLFLLRNLFKLMECLLYYTFFSYSHLAETWCIAHHARLSSAGKEESESCSHIRWLYQKKLVEQRTKIEYTWTHHSSTYRSSPECRSASDFWRAFLWCDWPSSYVKPSQTPTSSLSQQ